MNVNLEDFKTGWYGVTIGLNTQEIDRLIDALTAIKKDKSHFHLRSEFDGDGGVGDIEIYWEENDISSNMTLESLV